VLTTTPQGCKDSVTHAVVLMPVPKADFSINNPSQCFAGNNFVFNNTTLINGATGMQYKWVFTPGATFTTQNIANQVMPDTGNYNITLTATSGFGCKDVISKGIYVAETPTINISGNDACTGENIQFNATGKINSGSITSYSWTFGDGATSGLQNPLHAYASPSTWNVSCTITSDKGCTAVGGPMSVVSFPKPVADFSFEQLTSRGIETDHKLTFTGSGATGYLWTFYNGSTDFTGGPVFKTFTDTGRKPVKLWVVNTDGCTDSVTHLIYLKPELQMWIATSFSPNNDGLNETFGPSTVFGLSKFHMKIMDRWGELLFKSDDPKVPWDGRDKQGDPVPEGVYAYEISFRYIDGKIFVYQGTITVLR
jgi:gliding motility-associated-like protein